VRVTVERLQSVPQGCNLSPRVAISLKGLLSVSKG
jgi:hypothetical protein